MTEYQFLVDAYETEIIKVLSVWSMFDDGDLPYRPTPQTHGDAASMNRWCISASASICGSRTCSVSQ